MTDRIRHWDTVYSTKESHQVSWTQEVPERSLNLIKSFGEKKNLSIIDIGGGASNLVDHLLSEGYTDITVLDISKEAIEKAKKRLGPDASKVKWIVSDITKFQPTEEYTIWHDRATFHFLTEDRQIQDYLKVVEKANPRFISMGTFSKKGPFKCSGLEIKQYDSESMTALFQPDYILSETMMEDHTTPFNSIQNFIFCSFRKA